ncbi:hypothetical protein D4764_19G0002610 [Takifugu flavidus]|uniref:Uncharacterized protein n=1 Tax=Takifugu flavidus TaxID=433684 RepID=A0A5C6NMR5_9TELE|nr:hypothetical protein D4764_19G0002610 [Takifugu flavidus]
MWGTLLLMGGWTRWSTALPDNHCLSQRDELKCPALPNACSCTSAASGQPGPQGPVNKCVTYLRIRPTQLQSVIGAFYKVLLAVKVPEVKEGSKAQLVQWDHVERWDHQDPWVCLALKDPADCRFQESLAVLDQRETSVMGVYLDRRAHLVLPVPSAPLDQLEDLKERMVQSAPEALQGPWDLQALLEFQDQQENRGTPETRVLLEALAQKETKESEFPAACTPATTQGLRGLLDCLAGKDPVESQVQQEGAASLVTLVYLDSRETEDLQERKEIEASRQWARKDREDLLVHQEKAGQALQVLQAPRDLVALLAVQGTPVSVVLPDRLDTVTPPSVSAFLTTGRDTEVRTHEKIDRCSQFLWPLESHDLRTRAHIH